MAGTSGNLGWAESAAADVTEPSDALKADGYGVNEIPTHEHWNWLLREHGRAAVRRFASTEALIQARRSGTGAGVETGEDVGLVLPFVGAGGFIPQPWSVPAWSKAGSVVETEIAVDGEYVWVTHDNGAGSYYLRGLARSDFSLVVEANTPAQRFSAPVLATAGGNVYTAHSSLGTTKLQARSRTTCEKLYELDTGEASAAVALATDGYYVAMVAGNKVILYEDTGAALAAVAGGSHNHTAALYCVAMDGVRLVAGGSSGPGHDLHVWEYGAGGLSALTTLSRGAACRQVAFDGTHILSAGDISGANYVELFWSLHETTPVWTGTVATADVAIVGDLAVLAQSGQIVTFDLRLGMQSHLLLWDAGAGTAVNRLAWDNDALFVLGNLTGGGVRARRYAVSNQPALFSRLSSLFLLPCAVHSLVQPVR